jgi:hypothetical protein
MAWHQTESSLSQRLLLWFHIFWNEEEIAPSGSLRTGGLPPKFDPRGSLRFPDGKSVLVGASAEAAG